MARSSFTIITTWLVPMAKLGSGGGRLPFGPSPAQLWTIVGSTFNGGAWREAWCVSVAGSETMVRALDAPEGTRASISSSSLSAPWGAGSGQVPGLEVERRTGWTTPADLPLPTFVSGGGTTVAARRPGGPEAARTAKTVKT